MASSDKPHSSQPPPTIAQMKNNLDSVVQRIQESSALPSVVVPPRPEAPSAALPHLAHSEVLAPLLDKETSGLSKKDRAAMLALPPDSLVKDLCVLLQYATSDYRPDDEDDWDWLLPKTFFLAAETGLPAALPCLLDVLRIPAEQLEHFFGDILTEDGPWALRQFLPGQLDTIAAFLREPGISSNGKICAIIALQEFGGAYPDHQAVITTALQQVAEEYLRRADDPGLADAWIGTELGMLMLEQPGAEQKTIGYDLEKAGLWDPWLAGTAEEVVSELERFPWYRNNKAIQDADAIWRQALLYAIPHEERPQTRSAADLFENKFPVLQ